MERGGGSKLSPRSFHIIGEMNPTGPRRFSGRRAALGTVFLLWVIAIHGSLWWIAYNPESRGLGGDEKMYWRGAQLLAAGQEWYPEPLWPGFYAAFLGRILAGTGGSMVWVSVVQSAMLAAIAVMLFDLTRRVTHSRVAGTVAGGSVLAYPPLVAFVHYLWPEVLHMLFFLGALWVFAQWPRKPLGLVLGGILMGLALLTKGILGMFFPVVLWPLAEGDTPWRRLQRPALVMVVMTLVIAPTVYSNYQRSTGVLISNSLAFNIWVGINDRARKNFMDRVVDKEWWAYKVSASTFQERNEILKQKIMARINERGFAALLGAQLCRQPFRILDKDSFLTDQLPGGEMVNRRRGYRGVPPLIAAGLRSTSYGLYALLLIGATLGLVARPPRREKWLRVYLAFLAYNLVALLFLHVKSRYRIQMLPFLFIYAGCAAAWICARLGWAPTEKELWSQDVDHRVGWLMMIPAAVLLFLAFGRPLIE